MNKPYTICHMMMSVDGRIDCGMTVKIPGTDEYYTTLEALDAPVHVSGRVTAELEMALPGRFEASEDAEWIDHPCYSKKRDSRNYEVVLDTHGMLLWPHESENDVPMIIILSEKAAKEYIDYLDRQNISWIVCGHDRIDLPEACEILHDVFGVERMAVVGGGSVNAGFLDAGLLDEVSIILGPAIDGRGGMTAVFDNLPMDREPVDLKLKSVESYPDGAIWIRYLVD